MTRPGTSLQRFNLDKELKKLVRDKIAGLRAKAAVIDSKINELNIAKSNPRYLWNDRAICILSQEIDDLIREYAGVNLFPRDSAEEIKFHALDGEAMEPEEWIVYYRSPVPPIIDGINASGDNFKEE